MIRSILALGAFVALAAPAMAGEYYIVHGQDRHCNVVERIPEDHEFIRVGPLSFSSRDEAERHVRIVCSDNGYYRGEEGREERRENR
jgi:hypothetical protein